MCYCQGKPGRPFRFPRIIHNRPSIAQGPLSDLLIHPSLFAQIPLASLADLLTSQAASAPGSSCRRHRGPDILNSLTPFRPLLKRHLFTLTPTTPTPPPQTSKPLGLLSAEDILHPLVFLLRSAHKLLEDFLSISQGLFST